MIDLEGIGFLKLTIELKKSMIYRAKILDKYIIFKFLVEFVIPIYELDLSF